MTFEVTLRDGTQSADALEFVDAVARLAEEFDLGAVTVTAPRSRALRIAPQSRSVTIDGQELPLTRIEFDLLLFLARHPRLVFTRSQLLSNVWGHRYTGERTVDVHIRRLRAWLGDGIVTTVRGVGYRLASDAPIHWERLSDPVSQ